MSRQDGPPDAVARPAHLIDSAAAIEAEPSPSMTRAEQDRLAVCEAVVDEGLRTFVEVGTALATIRDERLYRHTHGTFAEYAHDRFGLGRAQSYRMIDAAAVAMSPIGDKITNEAQARELVPLLDDPDRLRDVVAKAEATGKITAKSLRAARTGRRDDLDPDQVEAEWAALIAEDEPAPVPVSNPATYHDLVREAKWITARLARVRKAYARLLLVDRDHPEQRVPVPTDRLEALISDLMRFATSAFDNYDDDPDVLAAIAYLDQRGLPAERLWQDSCAKGDEVVRDAINEWAAGVLDERRHHAEQAAYAAQLFAALADAGGAR